MADRTRKTAMLLGARSGPDPTRFMDTLNGSDRLLGLFSQPEPTANHSHSLELNEDDIFLSASFNSPISSPLRNPNPNTSLSAPARRRFSDRNFGILAALSDRNHNPNLMPKFSMSFSSSAMIIPPSAKAVQQPEKALHSSAPVSIPVVSARNNRGGGLMVDGDDADEEEEEDEMRMRPPHEIVARREGRDASSPMTTFSVLEGAGRTLKGKDLRRVRNAIFRRAGIVD